MNNFTLRESTRLGRCLAFGIVAVFTVAVAHVQAADESALIKGRSLHQAGKLVDAEKLLAESLAAIDAGELSRNQLGQCLRPLMEIYRTWGRNDKALAVALRYRKFIREQPTADAKARNESLCETAIEISDIRLALGQYVEADQAIEEALTLEAKRASPNPVRRLKIELRSANIAQAREDTELAAERWQKVAADAAASLKAIEKGDVSTKFYPDCTTALVNSYVALGKSELALQEQRKLRDFHVKANDPLAAVRSTSELTKLAVGLHDYPAAAKYAGEALALVDKLKDSAELKADLLAERGGIALAQERRTAALADFKQAATLYTAELKSHGTSEEAHTMTLLGKLQSAQQQAGAFPEAIIAGRTLVKLRTDRLGGEHPLALAAISDLGALYGVVGDHERARPLLAKSLEYYRKRQSTEPIQLARALNDLAVVERATGSFAEAEKLFAEALAVRERILKPDDLRLAYSQSNLASAYVARGDYAQAILLYKRAIEIYRKRGESADDALSNTLLNVAMAYKSQGQLAKAADYCRQSLDVYQRAFGQNAPGAIAHYNALASLDIARGHLKEATRFNASALDLLHKNSLDHEAVAAAALHHQATIEYLRDQLDDAQRHWRAALAIQEETDQPAATARTLNYLARLASLKKSPENAESLYRRALKLQEQFQAYPTVHYLTYCNLAQIVHDQGRVDEAIELLKCGAALVETPRAGTTGAEGERAEFFAQYASAFDLLVEWNLEAGQVEQAFAFAERGRNRTFLDQLALQGVDLRETVAGPEGDRLRERERTLRSAVGTLRARAAMAKSQSDAKSIDAMTRQLTDLQNEYAQVWSEIRSASSLYRERLAHEANVASLAAVEQSMKQSHSVMLFYYLGAKHSYLLVIGAEKVGNRESETGLPTWVPLTIPESLAGVFSVPAGALTRATAVQLVNQYLHDLRDRGGGRGLAGIVTSPKGIEASNGGAALAEVLLPRDVRNLIAKEAPASVVIVPDGALNQLPFEALLLGGGKESRYVLDVFPPIAYAPSASILLNLESRDVAASSPATVLTVGNPQYNAAPVEGIKATLAAVLRDAYVDLGGVLPPLPGTSLECARVAKAFGGKDVTLLEGPQATEANVRAQIAGRRYLHLAAHGLVDQQHDNLFGAIALTPPAPGTDTAEDDGFLSLHEIHGLNLAGCDVAVLSACQTNVGPDRPLEAGSTLAQAFLAAGAKRVVCSHWNVDDASTAEMIGTFFAALAHRDSNAGPISYAAALHDAQKKIRGTSRWSAPYYWAPFVLIGPASDR